MDLIFHGSRFVLIEFAGAILVAGGLGALSLRSGLAGPDHPVVWEIALGVLLASFAANYVPLLIYAIVLIRSGTTHQEVALELEQAKQSQRQYGIQQFLLLVPFAVLVIAVAQTLRRRSPVGP